MNLYAILRRNGWRSAADLEQAARRSARADLPVDEIIPIADTVIVRPDPEPAAA